MTTNPFGADSLPFRLSPGSAVPPYEQIRGQLTVMVAAGRIGPGTRLPTIRNLAGRLGLAPGTIARAYRELEADGMVVGRGRQGTFVVDDPPRSEAVEQRRSDLDEAAFGFMNAAIRLGVGEQEAIAAVRSAFDR